MLVAVRRSTKGGVLGVPPPQADALFLVSAVHGSSRRFANSPSTTPHQASLPEALTIATPNASPWSNSLSVLEPPASAYTPEESQHRRGLGVLGVRGGHGARPSVLPTSQGEEIQKSSEHTLPGGAIDAPLKCTTVD